MSTNLTQVEFNTLPSVSLRGTLDLSSRSARLCNMDGTRTITLSGFTFGMWETMAHGASVQVSGKLYASALMAPHLEVQSIMKLT